MWDWDIQHLYELEHLWLYLDQDEKLIAAEGSAHGGYHPLALVLEKGRLKVYSEPGKHAFADSPDKLKQGAWLTNLSCGPRGGSGDLLIKEMFKGQMAASTLEKRLAKAYMKAHAFSPSYDFSQVFDLKDVPCIPWETLKAWILKGLQLISNPFIIFPTSGPSW
ncbi:MAG: hypothetical protein R2880_15895 [Deinococcales bacterium]